MKKEGFDFIDESAFMRQFGVVKKTGKYTMQNGRRDTKIKSSEKRLPGVSPLVFTKFLLENSVFLSLEDMSEGLPTYNEISMPILMDQELQEAYSQLEQNFKNVMANQRNNGNKNLMGSFLQTLSVYPDMPYGQPPILDPDTNQSLLTPPELSQTIRNKELALLNLVQQKKDAGEKVLVYYNWTNRTDIGKKIPKLFKEQGIKCAVLEKVVPEKREEWIKKQVDKGIDVIITNPKLVETGLDLLDFTTIIFYQVGYNIFTLRQASRRSWRLSQTKPIEVYFLYYENTIQAQALSLMATKMQAAMAIEGKFSEEGLRAMSNNEDMLTQIANSVVNGIKNNVNINTSSKTQMNTVDVEKKYKIRKVRVDLPYLKRQRKQIAPFTPTQLFMLNTFSNTNKVANLY